MGRSKNRSVMGIRFYPTVRLVITHAALDWWLSPVWASRVDARSPVHLSYLALAPRRTRLTAPAGLFCACLLTPPPLFPCWGSNSG